MTHESRLVIDGSHGEGGGQILRTSLALAALLNRPIEIINIRRGRKKPGLQPQHLTAVQALTAITKAHVTGANLGSEHLRFEPRELAGGEYEFDVAAVKASAGSVGLVFHAAAPALFCAKQASRLILKGGTHVPWSPPTTYLQFVFLPMVEKLGLRASIETLRWGWYPTGGGIAAVTIHPCDKIAPVTLTERGQLEQIECLSVVSNLPRAIAERQQQQVIRRLHGQQLSAQCEILEAPSAGKGTCVFLLARYEHALAGFSSLGARGKPAEQVANEAIDEFLAHHESGMIVDKHLADQLLIYLALAHGSSEFTTSEVTQHLLTHVWVIEQFLPVKCEVSGALGQPGRVTVASRDDQAGARMHKSANQQQACG
ncbi:MAG: RNA 3'-terminal phosphate cyclase [Acidobacteriota bacterium]|nr:RNA 3'-terminal phosphate cyclase [Blastocatellia bacterium]MDW8238110.1 RNA 3'-terminal phosphate cyclase [Acidobacteriota bacterium]